MSAVDQIAGAAIGAVTNKLAERRETVIVGGTTDEELNQLRIRNQMERVQRKPWLWYGAGAFLAFGTWYMLVVKK